MIRAAMTVPGARVFVRIRPVYSTKTCGERGCFQRARRRVTITTEADKGGAVTAKVVRLACERHDEMLGILGMNRQRDAAEAAARLSLSGGVLPSGKTLRKSEAGNA